MFEASNRHQASNHFLRAGQYTRFCDWRFIHRARLGVLPLKGTVRVPGIDTRCRVCGYPKETTAHVLCHCMKHSAASNNRHRSVLKHLTEAMGPRPDLRVERTLPGSGSLDKPDLVILNEDAKQAVIVDIACPFDNKYQAFLTKRTEKKEKYAHLVEFLVGKGYTVHIDALLVGSLGSWDPANEPVLGILGIPLPGRSKLRRLIVSDVIRWSRDIYVEHVSGVRQYKTSVQLPA